MQIQTRAVELSSGAEVLAHARAVRARRRLLKIPLPKPITPILLKPFIDDDTYSTMLQTWVGDAAPVDPTPPGERVCRVVAQHFEITYAELIGGSRRQVFVFPRHVAMYICIRVIGYSYPQTAHVVGRVDHGTVIHAVRKMKARVAADEVFAADVVKLIARCNLPKREAIR